MVFMARGEIGAAPHDRLAARVEEKVSDGQVLDLIRGWLKADILKGLERRRVSAAPHPEAFHPSIPATGSFDSPRHQHPVLFVRRHVSPVAPRREHIERDQAEDRGGQAEKRQDGHAAARPVLDLERIARAQNQIERIGAEGAQEQRERLEDGPSHQQNNFSYRFRNMAAVTPQI